jgi:hypothetical protein
MCKRFCCKRGLSTSTPWEGKKQSIARRMKRPPETKFTRATSDRLAPTAVERRWHSQCPDTRTPCPPPSDGPHMHQRGPGGASRPALIPSPNPRRGERTRPGLGQPGQAQPRTPTHTHPRRTHRGAAKEGTTTNRRVFAPARPRPGREPGFLAYNNFARLSFFPFCFLVF